VPLTLLPDLGDLLRLHPHFNAGTLVEALRHLGAPGVLWASSADPDHPLRDALPAARLGITDLPLADWSWADAEYAQLTGFLNQFPQGRERLRAAGRAGAALADLVTAPLTLTGALDPAFLARVQEQTLAVQAALDEGPGTRWRERRLNDLAAQVQGRSGVLLAPLDDVPDLLTRLDAQLPDLSAFQPGETGRLRALADRAWQLNDTDDLNVLLAALHRESGDPVTPRAELDAAAAGIHLAVGDLPGARALLEQAAHALTDDLPRSLPGLVLARLGQVRDALGDRELAQRTYRAVLALNHAPQVARDAATAGLSEAFRLELT
jgi:tetratricopeptide (TPR) repeat protein